MTDSRDNEVTYCINFLEEWKTVQYNIYTTNWTPLTNLTTFNKLVTNYLPKIVSFQTNIWKITKKGKLVINEKQAATT